MKGGKPRNLTLAERVFRRIQRAPSGCWEWTGAREALGYGRFWLNGRMAYAHRVVYELLVEPIPDGLQIDHLCRNACCVNPSHLDVVTQRENLRRGVGFSGLNARKTHCSRGHEFSPENTAVQRNGSRQCLACRRLNQERAKVRREARRESWGQALTEHLRRSA